MGWIDNCTNCGQQKEFYGISHKATEGGGVERFRWQHCGSCGMYSREEFTGRVLSIQKEEPPKGLFRTGGGGKDE